MIKSKIVKAETIERDTEELIKPNPIQPKLISIIGIVPTILVTCLTSIDVYEVTEYKILYMEQDMQFSIPR